MNEHNIKVHIKWIVPLDLVEKVQQPEMCHLCFDMEQVVACENAEDNCNYDIVIDALSNSHKISAPEQFLKTLDERSLRYLIRGVKCHIDCLGLLEPFVPEIRKLYAYAMELFPNEIMRYKLLYATIGEYKYINQQSINYLIEYAAHYEDNICYDDNRALAYYLLALNENDTDSAKKLFQKALGLFEVSRLDDDFHCEIYACEHALCLIEWADIVSAKRVALNEYIENKYEPCKLPYEKSIEIMKPYIKYEVSKMSRFVGEKRKEYEDLVRSLGEKIDARLRKSQFASSYCGILPRFCEECINPLVKKL